MADTSLDRVLRSKTGSKEPLLQFRWVCTELPFGLPPEYVEEAQITWVNLAVKEGKFGAATFSYYPGFSDIDQFSLVLTEDSKGTSTKWVMAWLAKIKDFGTGNYALPTAYKRNMKFQLLDTRGEAVLDIEMVNVWPITRDAFGLNYTDKESYHKVNVTFSVDDQNVVFHTPPPDTFDRSTFGSITTLSPVPVPEVNGQLPIPGQSAPNNPLGAPIAGTSDLVNAATGREAVNGLTVNNPIQDQNPIPPLPDSFEAALSATPAATTETPPEKTYFDKLVGSVRSASSNAANRLTTALKDTVGTAIDDIEPSDLADSQSRRNWVNNVKGELKQSGENQGTAYAANVVGSAARVSYDNLVDQESSGATEQQLENQKSKDRGFWSDVMDSATSATKDFTDSAITAAEDADPDDSSFPENIRRDVNDALNDNQDTVTKDVVEAAKDSGRRQYEDWKTDYEDWRETRQNDNNLPSYDEQGLANDFE